MTQATTACRTLAVAIKVRALLIPALLALAACGQFPKDSENTSAEVAASGIKIGWVEGDREDADLKTLVASLAAKTGHAPLITGGSAERLLMALEEGEFDLVVGSFDAKTPWIKRVTFSRPVATHQVGPSKIEAKAAMRNGEHAWAIAVDRAVLEIAPQ